VRPVYRRETNSSRNMTIKLKLANGESFQWWYGRGINSQRIVKIKTDHPSEGIYLEDEEVVSEGMGLDDDLPSVAIVQRQWMRSHQSQS